MVLFSLGLALEKLEHYSQKVPPLQESAAASFLKELKNPNSTRAQDALQRFLLSIFTQDGQGSSHYTFTAYKFLVFYSFRQGGSLSRSGVITQYFSKIVFFGRGAIFKEIHAKMKKKRCGFFAYVINLLLINTVS